MNTYSAIRFVLLLYVGVCTTTFGQERTLSTEQQNKIDQLFSRWNTTNSPGMAIGIVSNGEMLYSKGYGLSNIEHKVANTPSTAFNIASNSKQFTAAAILILNVKKKLDLNQSVKEIFPEFPNYFQQITIKHLLHHTSGIRDYSQLTYLTGLRPNDYYNNDDILRWITQQQALNFEPGESFLYSNSNYWLLGQIVQKIAGTSLATFAEKEIFKPLKMQHTRFIDNNSMLIQNRASGYSSSRQGGFRNTITSLEHIGSSGVYTTVNDLKKWIDAYHKNTFLPVGFWTLMSTKGRLNNGKEIAYACALEIQSYKGLPTIEHGGRAPGYVSDIIRFPKEKFAVIVLANIGNTNATQLGYQIASIFLKDKFNNRGYVKQNTVNNGFIYTKSLSAYTGAYWNAKDAYSRKIVVENDTLLYARNSTNRNKLLHVGKRTFKMMNTPQGVDVVVKFLEKNRMTFIENGSEVAFFSKYIPAAYTNETFEKYTGTFYSQELASHYEFKKAKNSLQLFINGKKSVFLAPVMNAVFNSPMALFKFHVVEGRAINFTISTPRVKNVLFKRVD